MPLYTEKCKLPDVKQQLIDFLHMISDKAEIFDAVMMKLKSMVLLLLRDFRKWKITRPRAYTIDFF